MNRVGRRGKKREKKVDERRMGRRGEIEERKKKRR